MPDVSSFALVVVGLSKGVATLQMGMEMCLNTCASSGYSNHKVEAGQGVYIGHTSKTSRWELPAHFCVITGPSGDSITGPSGVHSQLAAESTVELEF